MAIAYVGSASADSNTVSLPSFTPGDVAIVQAFRSTDTTVPTVPSGWTWIVTNGGSAGGGVVGFRTLQSGDTTIGTWTNATQVGVAVYSGVHGVLPWNSEPIYPAITATTATASGTGGGTTLGPVGMMMAISSGGTVVSVADGTLRNGTGTRLGVADVSGTGSVGIYTFSASAPLAYVRLAFREPTTFPVVDWHNSKQGTVTSNSDPWTLTYPEGLVAGDLIVVLIGRDGGGGGSAPPTGFLSRGAIISSAVTGSSLVRESDGTESGTFSWSPSANEQGVWATLRIPAGAWSGETLGSTQNDPTSGGVVGGGTNNGTGTTLSWSALNPASWDVEDTLWIAWMVVDRDRTIDTFPSGYSLPYQSTSGGANGCTVGIAVLESATASETPGNATISASDEWGVHVVAIQPAAASGGTNAPAGLASGTGAALGPSARIKPTAGAAAGTGTALAPLAGPGAHAGPAAGTGTAYDVTAATVSNIEAPAGLASGAGVAHDAQIRAEPAAELASGTGAALDPTAGVQGHAAVTTGTGTAYDVTARISASAQLAAGSGTAYDATVDTAVAVNAPAGLASGSGTAYDVTAAVKPNAALAAGTGAALQPQAGIKPTAGVATGGGAAGTAASDTFTEGGTGTANLSTHTAETGGAWVKRWTEPGYTRDLLIDRTNDRMTLPSGFGVYGDASLRDTAYSVGSVTVGDGYIEAQLPAGSLGTSWLMLRMDPTNPDTFYFVKALGTTLYLFRNTDYSYVQITTAPGTSGDWYRFRAAGSSPTTLQVERRTTQGALGTGWHIDTTDNTAANQILAGYVGLIGEYDDDTGDVSGTADNLTVWSEAASVALSPQARIGAMPAAATGTGTALDQSAAVRPGAGLAAGSGTAYDATVTTETATNAPAELASGTGTAHAPSASAGVAAGPAAGSGTAYDVTARISVLPGAATGTGVAPSPSAAVRVSAELVTGTAAAHDATARIAALPGAATGTGVAGAPTASLGVIAGLASGTGTALDPTVTSGESTNAPAELASGSGAAYDVTAAIGARAELVTITGIAFMPTITAVTIAIRGVTRDQRGGIIGSCEVHCFRTSDDVEVGQVTSGSDGSFEIVVPAGVDHYLVAYKVGTPDVAGTTVNTLQGTAA